MRVALLIASLVAAAAGVTLAQTPAPPPAPTVTEPAQITAITVTHAGTYTGPATNRPAEAGQETPTRTIGTVSNWSFVSDSTTIDGKVGTQFGVEFRIDGSPADERATLYLGLKFPPQGIRNPNTGELLHEARVAFPNMTIGALCLVGYGFDNAWEIVPGEWTLQLIYRDRVLAERNFTVSEPK
jgi:hypothetical protein